MMDVVKRLACITVLLLALIVGSVSAFAAGKIDINTATVEQLIEVKGIGEVLAQRIIDYRLKHGTFKSLEELDNVKGVGSKKLDKMLPYLTLSES